MAANNTNFYVRNGGSWKSSEPWVRVGGVWKAVQEVHVRVSGTWEHAYVRSNPIGLTFSPDWTQSYIESGPQIAYTFSPLDTIVQGDWDTVGHASGTQRASGLIHFQTSDIISAMGGRENCTDFDVYVAVAAQYTSNGIYGRASARSVTSSGTAPSTYSHVHGSYQTQSSWRNSPGDGRDGIDMNNAVGDGFLTDGYDTIIMHDYGDSTDSAGKEYYRGTFHGHGTGGDEPYIAITADY